MAAKKFDIIVFGATGFTGKHCVKELANIWDEHADIRWAVAGRNIKKLEDVVDWATEKTGRDLKQVGYISADVRDEASLDSMCQQGRLILNLVGPYHFYGQPVVEACVKNKSHHLDISGETQFLERMQLDYHKRAKEAGVYIVEACGFDSIPADMGILFTKKKFPGVLNTVESYITSTMGPAGASFNFGTLNSGLHVIANRGEIEEIRQKMNLTPLPECKPKLKIKNRLFYSDFNESWCVPFNATDVDMVNGSQRYLYEKEKQRPIQYGAYFTRPSFGSMLGLLLVIANLALFALCKCGRRLIEKYPHVFTFGTFTHHGPTEEQLEGTSFKLKFRGRGFSSEEVAQTGKEDMGIVTEVAGPEMAYVTTPIVMIHAGLTVLQETDKLPEKGGVYTPGAAFYKTSLIDRCNEHRVKFNVIREAYKL